MRLIFGSFSSFQFLLFRSLEFQSTPFLVFFSLYDS
jgi:hypothetical protein